MCDSTPLQGHHWRVKPCHLCGTDIPEDPGDDVAWCSMLPLRMDLQARDESHQHWRTNCRAKVELTSCSRWSKMGLESVTHLEGAELGNRRGVEILKELSPDEIFGPGVLPVGDKSCKVAFQLLVAPLCLTVGLEVVPRGQAAGCVDQMVFSPGRILNLIVFCIILARLQPDMNTMSSIILYFSGLTPQWIKHSKTLYQT